MRRESSQPILLSTVALFPMWEIIRPGGAEVNKSIVPINDVVLVLSDNVHAYKTGLVITNGATFEECQGVDEKLNKIEGSVQWWRGDLLNFAEQKYGQMYSQFLDEDKKNYGILRNLKWVASRFELLRRRD